MDRCSCTPHIVSGEQQRPGYDKSSWVSVYQQERRSTVIINTRRGSSRACTARQMRCTPACLLPPPSRPATRWYLKLDKCISTTGTPPFLLGRTKTEPIRMCWPTDCAITSSDQQVDMHPLRLVAIPVPPLYPQRRKPHQPKHLHTLLGYLG